MSEQKKPFGLPDKPFLCNLMLLIWLFNYYLIFPYSSFTNLVGFLCLLSNLTFGIVTTGHKTNYSHLPWLCCIAGHWIYKYLCLWSSTKHFEFECGLIREDLQFIFQKCCTSVKLQIFFSHVHNTCNWYFQNCRVYVQY